MLEPISLLEANPSRSSVLLDNTTLWSALRLARREYGDPRIRRYPDVPGALFTHDLLALASLCESIVLVDEIYVNATYSPKSLQGYEELSDFVKALTVPSELVPSLQEAVSELDHSSLSLGGVEKQAARFLFRSAHHSPPTFARGLFGSFVDEIDSGEPDELVELRNGTAFYLFASELLTVPYRPSPLRAQLLHAVFEETRRPHSVDPAQILDRVLSTSRESALQELSEEIAGVFDRSVEFNQVGIELPNIFLAIARESDRPEDAINVALSLRGTPGGVDARHYLGALFHEIQMGEIASVGSRIREFKRVARAVETGLGIREAGHSDLSLAWGPVSIGGLFNIPKRLGLPARVHRSLTLVRELYAKALPVSLLSPEIERVFLRHLPEHFVAAKWLRDS